MRVLITRPRDDAEPLAEALKRRGIESVIEPLISIEPVDAALGSLDDVRAFLVTSANGLRALAAATDRRDIAVLAVGPATAEAAREAGFGPVEQADGDVVALASLVERRLKPGDGRLVHIAGTTVAGDLSGRLSAAGYTVERAVLYHSEAAQHLTDETISELRAGTISHVLLFSPRTARIFAELVGQAGIKASLKPVVALCLSDAVASAADLDFAAKRIAPRPDQEALLSLLDTPPVPPRRPRRARFVVLAGLVVVAIGLTVVGIAFKHGLFEPYGLAAPSVATESERDQQLADRIDQLEQEIAALRSAHPTPAATLDLNDLERRVTALEQGAPSGPGASAAPALDTSKLDAVADRTTHLADEVSGIEARIAQTQAAAQASIKAASQRASFALAVAQLSEAVERGDPYLASLHAVGGLGDDETRDLVKPLEADAEHGLPTLDQLTRRFPALARDTKTAAIAGDKSGWLGEVRTFFASLIVIRRTDNAPGHDDVDGKLALAEKRLDAHDLAGAVAALDGLPENPASVLTEWKQDAERRLAAEQAIKALDAKAFSGLQGAG